MASGSHLDDVADQPEVDVLAVELDALAGGGEQAEVLTGHADGERAVVVDEVDQFAADLTDEHHPHDVHRLGRGDPQPAAELRGDVEAFEHS